MTENTVNVAALLTELLAKDNDAAAQAAQKLVRKTAPHQLDTERALLGGMLLSDTFDAVAERHQLKPEDFYAAAHKAVFTAMRSLRQRGEPLSTLLVINEMTRTNTLGEAGGAAAVARLEDVATAAHVMAYAGEVKELARRRAVLATAQQIAADAYRDGVKSRDAVASALDTLQGIAEEAAGGIVVERLTDRWATIKARLPAFGGTPAVGISTGYPAIDERLRGKGLCPADLCIVAARPSMGKTAFMLNLARNVAHQRVKSFVISLEMSGDLLLERLVATESGVQMLHPERHTAADAAAIEAALPALDDVLCYDGEASIEAIGTAIRKVVREHAVKVVFVDYLQLIASGGDAEQNRNLEVAKISRQLKLIARRENVAIVCLSQLSRAVEARSNKRPILSDLRDSGAIEQDADMIFFLHRDAYYSEDVMEKNAPVQETTIDVAKNRNGQVGEVRLAFDLPRQRFLVVSKRGSDAHANGKSPRRHS